MKPAPFNLLRPRSVDETLAMLQAHGDDAKVLAGGQSLVPLMNFRLAQPRNLIDLNGVRGLEQIQLRGQTLSVGAMVRQRDAERSPAAAERLPILREALEQVAHPAIRNRGTVGGSLAHADPSAELPMLAVALDAVFHLRSTRAARSIPARQFYQGYLMTDMAPDELLVEVDFRMPSQNAGWCCTEMARRHGDFAIVAVAVLLDSERDRTINFARVAVGGVGPAPLRVLAAEEVLSDRPLDPELFRQAADAAVQSVDPPADIHASSGYRRQLTGVLVRRALAIAATRVKGNG